MDYEIEDDELEDEREYTDRELAIRQKFVDHYLHDYDAVSAAMRCGWPRDYAKQMADKFMDEPYVLNEIKKREIRPPDISDDPEAQKTEAAKLRAYVLAGLVKNANFYGPGSTHAGRVAALAQISKLEGLDAPTRVKQDINHTGEGEGVFVVPGQMTPEEWAKQAMAHQSQLSEEVTGTKH